MKVLVLDEGGTYAVIQVVSAEYDPDHNGIGFFDVDGEYLYISNVEAAKCNHICLELVRNGYCDLTSFGEYRYELI